MLAIRWYAVEVALTGGGGILVRLVHGERCAEEYVWVGKQRRVDVLPYLTLRLRLAEDYLHKMWPIYHGIYSGVL